MKDWNRCAMCDEWYDPKGDRARIHDHPEPQSGYLRDDLLTFSGTYDEWLKTTNGQIWAEEAKK